MSFNVGGSGMSVIVLSTVVRTDVYSIAICKHENTANKMEGHLK
jgi:hypothetical protein